MDETPDSAPPPVVTGPQLPGSAAGLVYVAASGLDRDELELAAQLSQRLNRLGVESYLQGQVPQGAWWAPLLTPALMAAHFNAGRLPVLLVPEGAKSVFDLGTPWRIKIQWNTASEASPDTLALPMPPLLALQALHYLATQAGQPPALRNGWVVDAADATVLAAEHRGLTRLPELDAAHPVPYFKALLASRGVIVYGARPSALVARVLGAAVVVRDVMTDGDRTSVARWGHAALAWTDDATARDKALGGLADFYAAFCLEVGPRLDHRLNDLLDQVEAIRAQQEADTCWPQATLDALPGVYRLVEQWAQRADRAKWRRVDAQYRQWRSRCSLREIDGQIYAEHWAAGRIAALDLVIDHRGRSDDALADTLDAIGQSLIQPASIHVLSDAPAPLDWSGLAGLTWSIRLPAVAHGDASGWVILLEAGAKLAPQALAEWGWAAQTAGDAVVGVYADEDMPPAGDTDCVYPFFKPDCNVALLQSMNYIGAASLWRVSTWLRHGQPMPGGGVYAMALAEVLQGGRACLAHVDGVMFTAPAVSPANRENDEFMAAQQVLEAHIQGVQLKPLPQWGAWVAHAPMRPVPVSLIVPTGLQVGYLRSLLNGLARDPDPSLAELILVCDVQHEAEVVSALEDLVLPSTRVVTHAMRPYVHGTALNLGIAQAQHDCIAVCDDDVEPLHKNWLTGLVGYLSQADVACVAPRLMATRGDDAQLVGGPVFLGVQGSATPYLGEEHWVAELGVYGRLQVPQDVSAVLGHCFVLRKTQWARLGGFDADELGVFNTTLDFCLRLVAQGLRHVWTPLVGLLHHGGKSFEAVRRDARVAVEWADRALSERDALERRWGAALAHDPAYNRHLSLQVPFDVECDIVIDWQPRRADRPRALAVPLHSGAGQYRVVEPFAALQEAGLAQTAVVLPLQRGAHRLLQPIELLRAAPNCLVLQHSVDDGQLGLIDRLRSVAPHIPIIQMVDDLFGEVPRKHPNWGFQSREGHQRMIHALTKSQRMVVTTDALREHYARYISDVRRVPNALASQWDGLVRAPGRHARLRVGWVGAAQHRGDLEMITDVVAALASEVDWVFMGMCPDALRQHVQEFHPFVTIADYPKKMASLDLDIAIAPLEDNLFNRCKSNLRLLEYGAVGWPVVCSDVEPYRTDDPPVLRVGPEAQAWVDAIRSLYDPARRQTLASALAQWVNRHYRLPKQVALWQAALFDPTEVTP